MIVYSVTTETTIGCKDFLLNLGTELIGIVITVLFIEYLFELKQEEDEARRIAWDIIHELDYAVWVWQGGGKEFDYIELNNIIRTAKPTDVIASCTKNILTHLGYRSDNTLRTKSELLKKIKFKPLQYAIYQLKDLNEVAHFDLNDRNYDVLIAQNIITPISISISCLGSFLKLVSDPNSTLDNVRINPSIEQQELRYYGRKL